MLLGDFQAPSWSAPLDEAAVLRAIPPEVTIKGMFLAPLVETARTHGVAWTLPRDRYVDFDDYPVVEHARALCVVARGLYPKLPIRKALRRLGHPAISIFESAMAGDVEWCGADDAEAALQTIARGYALACSAARVTVVDVQPGRARVRFTKVHWFLDSHHVGSIEGALGQCGIKADVRVRLESEHTGDFLCTW